MEVSLHLRKRLARKDGFSTELNSAEGLNMGGMRSLYGVLGSWMLEDRRVLGECPLLCIVKIEPSPELYPLRSFLDEKNLLRTQGEPCQ